MKYSFFMDSILDPILSIAKEVLKYDKIYKKNKRKKKKTTYLPTHSEIDG